MSDSLELEIHIILSWPVGIEHRPSERVASAFNFWAISPVPPPCFMRQGLPFGLGFLTWVGSLVGEPQGSAVYAHWLLGLRGQATMHGFFTGVLRLNSGPHVCKHFYDALSFQIRLVRSLKKDRKRGFCRCQVGKWIVWCGEKENLVPFTSSTWIKTSMSLIPGCLLSAYLKHSIVWKSVSWYNTIHVVQERTIRAALNSRYMSILTRRWVLEIGYLC